MVKVDIEFDRIYSSTLSVGENPTSIRCKSSVYFESRFTMEVKFDKVLPVTMLPVLSKRTLSIDEVDVL